MLITRPEESYEEWCVELCDREASIMRKLWPTRGSRDMEKKDRVLRNIWK